MVSDGSESWPSGRPRLPRGFVDDFKRQRCAAAIADLAHEGGTQAVTTARVTARAKMAKATFYDLFDGRDTAFRYACDYGRELLLEALHGAAEVPGTWEERLGRTIGALLDAAAENPNLAELCIVHSKSLEPEHGKPYDGILTDAFAEVLTEILPADLEERVFSFSELAAAAIVSIVARWLITEGNEDLSELRGELTAIVSMPYRREHSARAARPERPGMSPGLLGQDWPGPGRSRSST